MLFPWLFSWVLGNSGGILLGLELCSGCPLVWMRPEAPRLLGELNTLEVLAMLHVKAGD